MTNIGNIKQQVQTYEIISKKINEEREESILVKDEYLGELRNPTRFAAKQELKQKHKRATMKQKGKRE